MGMRSHRSKRLRLSNTYVCCNKQLLPDLMDHDQVRLGTVDIFQGQEAKIVIVSLVRNSGDFDTDNATIGFLKVLITLKWLRRSY